MTALTPVEVEALQELRSRIPDIQLDEYEMNDLCLISWLRARNLNVDKAEQMLRNSLEFRMAYRYDDSLLTWNPPSYYNYYFPHQQSGFDKDGLPVLIIPACWWEPYVRKEMNAGRKDDVHRFIAQIAYRIAHNLKLQFKQENRLINQFVVIFDMRGFSVKHCTSVAVQDVLVEAFQRFDANFPETLKAAFIVNAPKVFSLMHLLIKQILSSRTLLKVFIFDSTRERWQKVLLKNIAEDQLPKYYGGILEDTLECAENQFSKVQQKNLSENVIAPGGEYTLEYEISMPGTVISWLFKTESCNIGFAVGSEDGDLIPYLRLDSHETIQHGFVTCLQKGKYVLTFDNTYSRFRAKRLFYIVSVDTPKMNGIMNHVSTNQ